MFAAIPEHARELCPLKGLACFTRHGRPERCPVKALAANLSFVMAGLVPAIHVFGVLHREPES